MTRRVYLDHSSTTPLDERVFEAMKPYFLSNFGNASSVHSFGREARTALELSRERIADILGARYDEIYFTSGGTESDNFAIFGTARAALREGKSHLIVSSIEHHAVLHPALRLREEGYNVTVLPVDEHGVVDPASVAKAITGNTGLISIMHVNNEVGTIEPLEEICRIAKEHGIPVHSDTVQSVGKIPVNVQQLGVDLASLAAHKVYGPKGIGAIYIRKGTRIDTQLHGGRQERNRRAGTENVPLAVGFAEALALCVETMAEDSRRLAGLRDYMQGRIVGEFEGVIVNGHPLQRVPAIANISFDSRVKKLDGEALIMGMDLRGVAVTSGSACTSGSLEPSHVLLAMGRDEATARASIRFSLGRGTSKEDIDYAVDALHEVVRTMR